MTQQGRKLVLQRKLREIIERDFGDLSSSSIVLTLEELVSDYEKRARQERSRPPVQEPKRPESRRGGSSLGMFESDDSSTHDMAEIGVVAESDMQLAQLLNQIVNIGALMLQVDEPLALNEQVSLIVEYPQADFSMAVLGRVVNISKRGTALEVTRLSREDRAALDQMYRHYQQFLEPRTVSGEHPGVERKTQINFMSGAFSQPPPAPESAPSPPPPALADEASSKGPSAHTMPPKKTLPMPAPTTATTTTSSTSEGGPFANRMRSTVHDARMSMRRQVSLIQPDERVITSSNLAEEEAKRASDMGAGPINEEFYGPDRSWIEPDAEPDRIEELVGDRVMDILLQLSGHHFSGLVEIEHTLGPNEQVKWRLSFDSGFLVDAIRHPRQARVELGHMLLLAKRVEKLHLSMAAAHAEENEQPLEQSLLDLELIDPTVLRHAIAGRLTFLLRLLCNTEAGSIRVYEAQKLPPGFLPLPTLRVHVAIERTIFQLIYESLRQISVADRNQMSAAELDTYPETLSEEYERIERAIGEEAKPLQGLAAKLGHGRRRLREVFTESTLSSADTFAVIFSLHRMGLLRFDRSLHHTVVRERFRENVTVKYLSVHKASYFEVLNVHWSSYDEVIQRAYDELLVQFDPGAMPEGLEAEVHTRVSEIRERVKSAYQVLARREHRHAYRTRIMPEYKLAHAIPLFLKQTELAERRQQWEEARDSILRVLELEPSHREAAARLKQIQAQIKNG